MKKLKLLALLAVTILAANPLTTRAAGPLEKDPAFLNIDKAIDLKMVKPEVDINLPRFLLADAISGLNNDTNSPLAGSGLDLADLLKDVRLIRVVVIEAAKSNKKALDAGIKNLQEELNSKWTTIIHVPEGNVGVYAMGDAAGESMAGLAVVINDGNDAVIGNVVGKISIGKVIKMASQMDKLPKDFMQKLGGLAAKASGQNGDGKKGDAKKTDDDSKKIDTDSKKPDVK